MHQKFFAIAGNAFTETIRQPIFFVLIGIGLIWLVLFGPALAAFSLESGKDSKIMIDVELASLLLYGLLASVFSASSVITREIHSFTVLTVISKPVSRPLFLLGKYAGISGALLVGYTILSIACLLTVRHGVMEASVDKFDQPVLWFGCLAIAISLIAGTFGNYVYGWHFTSTVIGWLVALASLALVLVLFLGPQWETQSPTTDFGDMQVIYGITMVFFGVLILTAFAVAFATRFNQVLTLVLCIGAYVVGLLSDYWFGRAVAEGRLWRTRYAGVPNFQFFWIGDAITQDILVPASQVAWVGAYTACYVAAVLALGVAMFQTREVG